MTNINNDKELIMIIMITHVVITLTMIDIIMEHGSADGCVGVYAQSTY